MFNNVQDHPITFALSLSCVLRIAAGVFAARRLSRNCLIDSAMIQMPM
jgi:hypothetical protein